MLTLNIKQGATFDFAGQYLNDDGTPRPLTSVTLQSQVRNGTRLVATLTVTVVDNLAGTYRITAPEGTMTWPPGKLYWDIKESYSGVHRVSETMAISVERAMTLL